MAKSLKIYNSGYLATAVFGNFVMNYLDEIVGKIVNRIEKYKDTELKFYMNDGSIYVMRHIQNSREDVHIEDINGDLNKFRNARVAKAYLSKGNSCNGEHTFYHIASDSGEFLTIRWIGISNGYYSVEVSFDKIQDALILDCKNLYVELSNLRKLVSSECEEDLVNEVLDILWYKFLSENDRNEINSN